jgi:hypothetical protein
MLFKVSVGLLMNEETEKPKLEVGQQNTEYPLGMYLMLTQR